MPTGIYYITIIFMFFTSPSQLAGIIYNYFEYIKGVSYVTYDKPPPDKSHSDVVPRIIKVRDPEPATLTGLILFLGIDSRAAFQKLERSAKYGTLLRRARLRIESAYEKRLHQQSSTGAIFALKHLGWTDQNEAEAAAAAKNLKISIRPSQVAPAGSEREVVE